MTFSCCLVAYLEVEADLERVFFISFCPARRINLRGFGRMNTAAGTDYCGVQFFITPTKAGICT